jgi:Holliday junction resolvase
MSGGRASRRKGDGIERELVNLHRELGIHCERYPLSGASRFRGSGHDIDLYVRGRDAAPLVAEVKSRANGQGFAQLEKWLGDYDALFLRRDRADALVLLPWRTWVELIRPLK